MLPKLPVKIRAYAVWNLFLDNTKLFISVSVHLFIIDVGENRLENKYESCDKPYISTRISVLFMHNIGEHIYRESTPGHNTDTNTTDTPTIERYTIAIPVYSV
jgi:hypothetical protein